jgi:alpha-beta hydrolase superfamily lysophospholipase
VIGERIWFRGSTGHRLAGLIDPPMGSPRGWGVFSHGFTLGKDSPAASRVCRQLAAEGIGMLRFDNLGLGDSEGDWGDGSFTTKVDDTVLAARYLSERGAPISILVGHSFGGAAAIAAAQHARVRAVATIAAPVEPSHVEHHYEALIDRVIDEGRAEWKAGARAFTLKRALIEDIRQASLVGHLRDLELPLLVMHSPDDDVVAIAHATRIFRSAAHPRSFVSLEGADHLLTLRGQAQRAARVISAWADPYLSAARQPRYTPTNQVGLPRS